MYRLILTWLCLLTLLLLDPASTLRADEGMWTLDNLPLDQLRERYRFTPTQEWLDHLRLSSVRVGGASGSFVSPDGLVMTDQYAEAFEAIARATRHSADSFAQRVYRGFVGSGLVTTAGTIVRYVTEVEKPDAERARAVAVHSGYILEALDVL